MGVIRAKQAIADTDLPSSIARDAEYLAADAAHLAAAHPHNQYVRFLTMGITVDLPNMAPNSLDKRFFSLTGARTGDPALLLPINTNLFTNASWPFLFAAVVEGQDNVACYFRNDHTAAIDLTAMQFKIVVLLF